MSITTTLQAFLSPYPPNPHLPHLPNNPNSTLLCYLSPRALMELNSQALSPIRIQNSLNISILAFAVEIPEEIPQKSKKFDLKDEKIFLGPEIFGFLNLKKGEKVSVFSLNGVLPMRNYELNSNFNYFPNLPIAKRIHLINVMNINSFFIVFFDFSWFYIFFIVFISYAIETHRLLKNSC